MIYTGKLITTKNINGWKASGYSEEFVEGLIRDNLSRLSDADRFKNDDLPPYHPELPLEDEKAIHAAVKRLECSFDEALEDGLMNGFVDWR